MRHLFFRCSVGLAVRSDNNMFVTNRNAFFLKRLKIQSANMQPMTVFAGIETC